MKEEDDVTNVAKNVFAKIEDWSSRIKSVAIEVGRQLDGSKPSANAKFYIHLLRRQVIILADIQFIVKHNPQLDQVQSVFILFRCLLDDFIMLLYLQTKNFSEGELDNYSAKTYFNHFRLMEESKNINIKHFKGQKSGMVTEEYYKTKRKAFFDDGNNKKYFEGTTDKFKNNWPSTKDIVANLEENNIISEANAHSFILWKYLSNYVHYSVTTNKSEEDSQIRLIELIMLQEGLSYCLKTLAIISDVLKDTYGLKHGWPEIAHQLMDEINSENVRFKKSDLTKS